MGGEEKGESRLYLFSKSPVKEGSFFKKKKNPQKTKKKKKNTNPTPHTNKKTPPPQKKKNPPQRHKKTKKYPPHPPKRDTLSIFTNKKRGHSTEEKLSPRGGVRGQIVAEIFSEVMKITLYIESFCDQDFKK